MAAQATPAECGVNLEPVETVVSWAKENARRTLVGEKVIKYEEFKIEYQGEEQ